MRNTILGRRLEGRRFEFVFLATLIAGFWSLMSGTRAGDDVAGLRVPARLATFQVLQFRHVMAVPRPACALARAGGGAWEGSNADL